MAKTKIVQMTEVTNLRYLRRKRNSNGDEKCCYSEEYAKILEHFACHQELGLHVFAKREAYKDE